MSQAQHQYRSNSYFGSKQDQDIWEAHKSAMLESIFAPAVVEHEKAKALVDDILSGDSTRSEKAWNFIAKAARSTDDYLAGRKNDTVERHKTINSSVMPITPAMVITFLNMGDENQLDMEWMKVYAIDPLGTALAASVAEIKNMVEWYDLDTDTSTIPESNLTASTWADYRPRWKGARVNISREIMQRDPMTTVNLVVSAIRYKAEIKKSQDAYTSIQAGIVTANGAGQVTSYTGSSLPRTFDAARYALATRNNNKGYQLSAATRMQLLANIQLEGVIEAAYNFTNFIAFGTQLPQRPIDRAYTYNLAADLGISGTKAALFLPQRGSRHGQFKDLTIENVTRIENNAIVFVCWMGYEFITESDQIQVVNLA